MEIILLYEGTRIILHVLAIWLIILSEIFGSKVWFTVQSWSLRHIEFHSVFLAHSVHPFCSIVWFTNRHLSVRLRTLAAFLKVLTMPHASATSGLSRSHVKLGAI